MAAFNQLMEKLMDKAKKQVEEQRNTQETEERSATEEKVEERSTTEEQVIQKKRKRRREEERGIEKDFKKISVNHDLVWSVDGCWRWRTWVILPQKCRNCP